MAAIASPGAIYDPFVQVFGTTFVVFIGLMFVAQIALLIADFLRQGDDERIVLHEALLRELDPLEQEQIELEIEEAVQAAGGTISLEQLLLAVYGQRAEAQRHVLILTLRDMARRALVRYSPLRQTVSYDEDVDPDEDSLTELEPEAP